MEGELRQNTWIVTDVPEGLLVHAPGNAMWREVLGGIGPEWRLLADEPEDTGLN